MPDVAADAAKVAADARALAAEATQLVSELNPNVSASATLGGSGSASVTGVGSKTQPDLTVLSVGWT